MSLYKKCCSITKSKCYSKNSDTNFIGRELQLSDYEIHPKSMTTQRFFSQSLLITLLSIKTENAQQLIFLLLYQTHFPPFPVKFKTLPLSQLRHREQVFLAGRLAKADPTPAQGQGFTPAVKRWKEREATSVFIMSITTRASDYTVILAQTPGG